MVYWYNITKLLSKGKLDQMISLFYTGDTLHLSGVDIIDGTPVLDIKPYVPSYDNPNCIHHGQLPSVNLEPSHEQIDDDKSTDSTAPLIKSTAGEADVDHVASVSKHHSSRFDGGDELEQNARLISQNELHDDANINPEDRLQFSAETECKESKRNAATGCIDPLGKVIMPVPTDSKECHGKLIPSFKNATDTCTQNGPDNSMKPTGNSSESNTQLQDLDLAGGCHLLNSGQSDEYSTTRSKVTVADWIKYPPIKKLNVRFTEHAESDLREFKTKNSGGYHTCR